MERDAHDHGDDDQRQLNDAHPAAEQAHVRIGTRNRNRPRDRAPDDERHPVQHNREANCGDEHRIASPTTQRPDRHALLNQTNQPANDGRTDQQQDERHMMFRQAPVTQEPAEHNELRLGEVEHIRSRHHDREAERDECVDGAG